MPKDADRTPSAAKFGESEAGPDEASSIRQPDSPMQSAATVLERYMVAADWYRRCLEDVIDKRAVRGLDEARQGYDAAFAEAESYLREVGAWTTT